MKRELQQRITERNSMPLAMRMHRVIGSSNQINLKISTQNLKSTNFKDASSSETYTESDEYDFEPKKVVSNAK